MDQFAAASPAYEILAELGRGTTGVVYKARHSILNRVVALKMPRLESRSETPTRLARFRREAEVLASLTGDPDPDFPTLYEVGEYQGQPYFVREFVEGRTLEQVVTARAMGVREGVGVLAAVARAVQRVHSRRLAHSNLHPSNILVSAGNTTKLIGFGRVGLLAGSGMLPPGASGVSAEIDVRALKETLGWLGAALGQPIPPPDSVDSPTAFADALDSYLGEVSSSLS